MKKLNIAIIGQGRSGRNIHGKYLLTEANKYYNVKYVVDADAGRRAAAERDFVGCKTLQATRSFLISRISILLLTPPSRRCTIP